MTAPADTELPSAPANPAIANIASTSVTITWTASTDNIGVTGYEILRDGAVAGTTSTTAYLLTGLAPFTSYVVTVRAMDAADNKSTPSAPLYITTLPPGSNNPPTLPLDWANQYDLNPYDTLHSETDDGLSNYAKYNLGYNPTVAMPGADSFDNIVPVTWNNLVSADPGRTGPVGTTADVLTVDKSGAANYSIPFYIVPGTAGMQPSASLNYSSHSSGNIAGYGWTLSGLSVITRGPKTRVVDGTVSGVDFSYNDEYYLDGQRLIYIGGGGEHGTDGAEYRAEFEGFSRVVAVGSAGEGPQSFKVWTKSGRCLEFGGTTDSRLLATNDTTAGTAAAQAYAISRVNDAHGNTMTYSYDRRQTTGEQYLMRIDYTSNGNTGLAAYASLRFDYEERPDTSFSYMHGVRFSTTRRLKAVSACFGESVVRLYEFSYLQKDYSGRSLLLSVTESAGSGAGKKSFLPVRFTYSKDNSAPTSWVRDDRWAPPVPVDYDNNTIFVDINGDGRPDCVCYHNVDRVYLNTPAGWQRSAEWEQSLPWEFNIYTDKFADINGDGLQDFITVSNSFGDVYINTGTGFEFSPYWSISYAPDQSLAWGGSTQGMTITNQTVGFADINGDGRPDCIVHAAGTNYDGSAGQACAVFINRSSEGAGGHWQITPGSHAVWIPEQEPPGVTSAWEACGSVARDAAGGRRMLDINGDRLPDFVSVKLDFQGLITSPSFHRVVLRGNPEPHNPIYNDTAASVAQYRLPAPAMITASRSSEFHSLPPSPFAMIPSEMLELNGDGLVDMVRSNGIFDNRSESVGEGAWFNTGDGWVEAPDIYMPPFPLAASKAGWHGTLPDPQGVVFFDFNSDGIVDILKSRSSGLPEIENITEMWIGRVSGGWEHVQSKWAPPWPVEDVSMYRWPQDCPGNYSGAMFVDLNGDGAVDQVWHTPEGSAGAAFNPSANADRLVSVDNGLVTSTITYAPLTETDENGAPSVYTRAPNADHTIQDPVASVIPAMHVVKTITQDSGNTNAMPGEGAYDINYRYHGMRRHRLHGNLGFEWMSATDTRTGITTKTTYSQEYPTIGMAMENVSTAPDGTELSKTSTVYGIKILNNGKNRHIFPADTETATRNLDGTLLTYAAVTTDGVGDGSGLDAYGNPLSVVTVSGTGAEAVTTTVANTWSNHVDVPGAFPWLIGLRTASVSTAVSGAASLATTWSGAYDSATGRLKAETAEPDTPALARTTAYSYDDFGNRTQSVITGPGLPDEGRSSSLVSYDLRGRFPETITNALGHAETHTHDDALGVRVSRTDANGLLTTWTHDAFGRVLTETRPDGTVTTTTARWANPAHAPDGAVTLVLTQASGAAPAAVFQGHLGRAIVTALVQPGGTTAAARITVTRADYDNCGRVIRSCLPTYFEDAVVLGAETFHDILGRPVTVTRADDDCENGFTITTTAYTGRAVTTTDPLGRAETIEHDTLGRVTRRINNATAAPGSTARGEVTYAYDPLGRLTATHVHREDGSAVTTAITYDLLGRKTAMADPDVGAWTYVYNAADELTAQIDAKGQTTTMTYDALGRMTARADADSATTWTYDTATRGKGKLASVTHAATADGSPLPAVTETYSYDEYSRPAASLRVIGGAAYATEQEYDAQGRPTVTTHPGGFKTRNVYTALGFLKEVRAAGGTTGLPGDALPNQLFWRAEGYTVRGSIDTMILGNGLTYDRVISDVTGRVKTITTHSQPFGDLQYQNYLHDALDRVTRRVDDVTGLDESFTYDGLNRLTAWALSVPPASNVPPAQVVVAYDALGNITQKSDAGAYAYSAAHPHAIATISGGPLGARAHAHDANGNTLSDGTRSYEWTAANKLRQITQGALHTAFALDADRQRVVQTEQTAAGAFKTAYATPAYEKVTHPGGLVEHKYYIMTPFGRSAVRTLRSDQTVELRYLHQDALGSVTLVTDEYGRVENRFAYDPWGQRLKTEDNRVQSSGGAMTRGYTDHEHLEDFELIHMNARVYDPATGRFLSADRVVQDMGDSQTYNRYSYCANNPVNATDPTGNRFFDMSDEIMAAVDWMKQLEDEEKQREEDWAESPIAGRHPLSGTGAGGIATKAEGNASADSQSLQGSATQAGVEAGNDNGNTNNNEPKKKAPNNAGTGNALIDAKLSQGIYDLNFTGTDGYNMVGKPFTAQNGLRAAVFSNGTDNVLVYAGTSPSSLANWWANLTQAFGFKSAQYEAGIKLAQEQYALYGGNLRFAGHSLGGGIASAAAIITGGSANTFNAAGVHDNTLRGFDRSNGSVTSYYSTFDVLRIGNALTPASVPGNRVSLGAAGFHGIGGVINALGGGGGP